MKQPKMISPPAWPLKLLRLFIKKEYLEEIEGDMEEIFCEQAERQSLRHARRTYTWEALKLLRPILLKNIGQTLTFNQYPMFKNYFKISLRNLLKHPLSSFINVFGLSVAIGICLLVYTFMEYDYSIDQFHENKNSVYLTTFSSDRDGVIQQYGMTPRPLAEMLKTDFPQISKVCRIEDRNVVMKYEDNVFHERLRYADPTFLEVFTFPMKWGTTGSLSDLNSIVLSEDMSIKYFGEENPIGRDLLVVFDDKNKKAFTVTGVSEAFPKTHDIEFNFLINFENIRVADPTYNVNDWSRFLNATLIQVNDSSDMKTIKQGMEKYRALQNQAQPDWTVTSFTFEPLATLHERAANIKDAIATDYNVEGRIGMPIIAIFMIVLACFNYINIAIVSAAKRVKEIGVRKVIGANRLKVIVQFLTENIVITIFALLVGVLLCAFVFLPWFVQFTGWPLELRLLNGNIWIFLVVLLLFTGLASGIYPALYISNFDAIRILKGSLQFGRKNPLTKIFLGVQLIVACITITAGVVFTQNNDFQNNRSWGYNQKEALYVSVHDQPAYDRMKAVMLQNPNVQLISGSVDHLGKETSKAVMRSSTNQHIDVNRLTVDANYFNTMELLLTEGRVFKEHSENDMHSLVVNEFLVENLKLENPIGQQFEIDSIKYEIIGVLHDFHTRDFFSKIQPTIFTLASEDGYRYLSMRVKAGTEHETSQTLQAQWAKLYPEIPFQGGRQEDVWSTYFFSVDRSEKFNKVIASIAVLLASLGLYGLVTLNVSGRVREFSIRKTLGAGVGNIASIIIKQYAVLTIVAMIIGVPVSYIFTKAYLDMLFAYPMPMGYTGSIIALFILLLVLLAVISTQVKKVSKLNPVDGLKTE